MGPTAAGKTELALQLVQKLPCDIISVDSGMVYREMDIGTAKVSLAERELVPHHLIDLVNPDQDFSVAEFKQLADQAIIDILQRGKVPFLVGGTMLYIDAVVDNFTIPEIKPDFKLRNELEKESLEELNQKLAELDPDYSAEVDQDNPRRVIRALEYCLTTGQKFSAAQKKGERQYDVLKLGLQVPLPALIERINKRVDEQMATGLLAETKKLSAKHAWNSPGMSGIGYRQLGAYLRGEMSLPEAIERLKIDTRRYAKRQMTWWKRDAEICWKQI